ncbi:MAG: hypothetical protein K2J82_10000 [Muribaculaceae bacterium]|nr:hypothetical protein [Muribaculaceae bacterium]MDE6754926.1 hypothetical protein [Muribaculaceae bacterium]
MDNKEIHGIRIENVEYVMWPYKAVRINIPVLEACRRLNVHGLDLLGKLKSLFGDKLDAPLILHQEDVEWYIDNAFTEENPSDISKSNDEEEYINKTINLLINCLYFEEKIYNYKTKLVGLRDSIGRITVPPIFEDCKPCHDIDFTKTLATVKHKGRYWLTPRDGSGRLDEHLCFDSISSSFCYAWVIKDNKYGRLDSRTGKTIVPCEMDWLESIDYGFQELFSKNGKIGWTNTIDPDDNIYISPQFEAINLTTHQLKKDGEWGWLLRDGSFTSEPSASRRECQELSWNLKSYLKKRPISPDYIEEYYSAEEVFSLIEDKAKESFETSLLPTISFQNLNSSDDSEIALKKIEYLMETIDSFVRVYRYDHTKDSIKLAAIFPDDIIDIPYFPFINITIERDQLHVFWSHKDNHQVWKDLESDFLKLCYVLILPDKDTFRIEMLKSFPITELHTAACFIASYYNKVWGIQADQLIPIFK